MYGQKIRVVPHKRIKNIQVKLPSKHDYHRYRSYDDYNGYYDDDPPFEVMPIIYDDEKTSPCYKQNRDANTKAQSNVNSNQNSNKTANTLSSNVSQVYRANYIQNQQNPKVPQKVRIKAPIKHQRKYKLKVQEQPDYRQQYDPSYEDDYHVYRDDYQDNYHDYRDCIKFDGDDYASYRRRKPNHDPLTLNINVPYLCQPYRTRRPRRKKFKVRKAEIPLASSLEIPKLQAKVNGPPEILPTIFRSYSSRPGRPKILAEYVDILDKNKPIRVFSKEYSDPTQPRVDKVCVTRRIPRDCYSRSYTDEYYDDYEHPCCQTQSEEYFPRRKSYRCRPRYSDRRPIERCCSCVYEKSNRNYLVTEPDKYGRIIKDDNLNIKIKMPQSFSE